jgi:hypothetical protein
MVISIIDRFNRKCQFIFFLFLNSFALFAFTLYINPYYALFNRIIVGFTQVTAGLTNLDVYLYLFTGLDRPIWTAWSEDGNDVFSADI